MLAVEPDPSADGFKSAGVHGNDPDMNMKVARVVYFICSRMNHVFRYMRPSKAHQRGSLPVDPKKDL